MYTVGIHVIQKWDHSSLLQLVLSKQEISPYPLGLRIQTHYFLAIVPNVHCLLVLVLVNYFIE